MKQGNFMNRSLDIFSGKVEGKYDSLIQDKKANRLQYVFLRMIEMKGVKILPFDESKISGDKGLEYLAESQNTIICRTALPFAWYKEDYGDFIGFDSSEKPLIMRPKGRGYIAVDVDTGEKTKITEANWNMYSRNAITVIVLPEMKKTTSFSLIRQALRERKQDIVMGLLLAFVASLLGMAVPLAVGFITDRVLGLDSMQALIAIGITVVFTVIASVFINIFINRIKARIQTTVRSNNFEVLMHRLMNLTSRDERKMAGNLIVTVMPYLEGIDGIVGAVFEFIVYFVQCLLLVVILMQIGTTATGLIFYVILFDFILSVAIQFVIYRANRKRAESSERFTALKKEFLDNMESIKNNAIEGTMFYQYAICYDDYSRKKIALENKNQWLQIIGTISGSLGLYVIFMSVILSGETIASSNVASLTSIYTLLMAYLTPMFVSISSVTVNLPRLEFADDILSKETEKAINGGEKLEIEGKIELDNVTFSYKDNATPVIRNLSLKIEPGEYIGIAGTSGCGKSTLLRLMLGFERPDSGDIYFDDVNINSCDIQHIRSQFGVVLQDAAIITGNIRQNIGMSKDADMDKVEEAAKKAAIYDEIDAMPMKFNTVLSSESELVSGGQRQRIVMARALMNNPKVMFLDEATSAMDNVSQKKVKDNLDELGVTRIVIAHRLSTIRDCDRIIVMDKGQIAEQGTFDELMELDGLFAQMSRRNM